MINASELQSSIGMRVRLLRAALPHMAWPRLLIDFGQTKNELKAIEGGEGGRTVILALELRDPVDEHVFQASGNEVEAAAALGASGSFDDGPRAGGGARPGALSRKHKSFGRVGASKALHSGPNAFAAMAFTRSQSPVPLFDETGRLLRLPLPEDSEEPVDLSTAEGMSDRLTVLEEAARARIVHGGLPYVPLKTAMEAVSTLQLFFRRIVYGHRLMAEGEEQVISPTDLFMHPLHPLAPHSPAGEHVDGGSPERLSSFRLAHGSTRRESVFVFDPSAAAGASSPGRSPSRADAPASTARDPSKRLLTGTALSFLNEYDSYLLMQDSRRLAEKRTAERSPPYRFVNAHASSARRTTPIVSGQIHVSEARAAHLAMMHQMLRARQKEFARSFRAAPTVSVGVDGLVHHHEPTQPSGSFKSSPRSVPMSAFARTIEGAKAAGSPRASPRRQPHSARSSRESREAHEAHEHKQLSARRAARLQDAAFIDVADWALQKRMEALRKAQGVRHARQLKRRPHFALQYEPSAREAGATGNGSLGVSWRHAPQLSPNARLRKASLVAMAGAPMSSPRRVSPKGSPTRSPKGSPTRRGGSPTRSKEGSPTRRKAKDGGEASLEDMELLQRHLRQAREARVSMASAGTLAVGLAD